MKIMRTPYHPSQNKNGKNSNRAFRRKNKFPKQISEQRNVFISFDMDDERMINLLRSQAKDERFPFAFRDYSVKFCSKKWKIA